MVHLHEVRDLDTHYVIDPITMAITNANEAKNKLMLGDHNSEIYTFEIAKNVEGHDMTLCNLVEVHFINISADKAEKSSGVYVVRDLAISKDAEDTLLFTWEVSRESTMYAGSLNYRIKFACLDENGNYTYVKWTDVYKGIAIADGFDNAEVIAEEYSDILSEWEARINELENIKSAYEYAVEAGYQGTEEEFARQMANPCATVITDDGEGNVVLSVLGAITVTDDGNGNVVLA